MSRKQELLSMKTLSIKELAELHGVNVLTVYNRLRNYPGILDLEKGSKPVRIINNNKAKNFVKDVRQLPKRF